MLFVLCCGTALAEDISLGIAGWEKTEAGDHKAAIQLFLRCIAEGNLTPESLGRTYRNIGIALRRDERPKEAIGYYDKAIALKSDDVHKDYANRGNAYSDCKDYNNALIDYDKAQNIFNNYNEAYYNRGIVYERMDKNEDAVEQFKLAYKFGLRTQSLYERFVAHGLIKQEKPVTQPDDAPEPASPAR